MPDDAKCEELRNDTFQRTNETFVFCRLPKRSMKREVSLVKLRQFAIPRRGAEAISVFLTNSKVRIAPLGKDLYCQRFQPDAHEVNVIDLPAAE